MAHMMYMAAAERTRVERQTLWVGGVSWCVIKGRGGGVVWEYVEEWRRVGACDGACDGAA